MNVPLIETYSVSTLYQLSVDLFGFDNLVIFITLSMKGRFIISFIEIA